LSERVSARLKREGLTGRTLVLKLKTAEFRLRTRHTQLDGHTDLADRIFRTGKTLLAREIDGTRFRLIGIGVTDLDDGAPALAQDLIDASAEKRAKAEHAMDTIRGRFGQDGVGVGLTFSPRPGKRSG
jgi:DNA polymerase-4